MERIKLKTKTIIREIVEKEVYSPEIIVQGFLSEDEMNEIKNTHCKIVKQEYDNCCHLNGYQKKETQFFTSLDETPIDTIKPNVINDLEAIDKKINKEVVSFQVTKIETYGASFNISYLNKEEKKQKIEELQSKLEDRYVYSDGDMEKELEYLDECDVEVDVVENKNYNEIGDTISNNFEKEFGKESIYERRESVSCYILDRNKNYIKDIISNKKMEDYSEFIIETQSNIILLKSKKDYDTVMQNKNSIIEIQEDSDFNKFLIIFEQLY